MKTKLKIGDKCGRWTIVGESPASLDGRKRFVCCCECGTVKDVRSDMLATGESLSCGCLRTDKTSTHRKTNTRLYNIWRKMKERCYNKNHVHFNNYGGRGIFICDEWKNNFHAFYDWAIAHGYSDTLTIDRIDVNREYSPENCRWATILEQQNNTSWNHNITANGVTMSLSKWSRELGIPVTTIYSRIKAGWPDEEALTQPIDKRKSTKKRRLKTA